MYEQNAEGARTENRRLCRKAAFLLLTAALLAANLCISSPAWASAGGQFLPLEDAPAPPTVPVSGTSDSATIATPAGTDEETPSDASLQDGSDTVKELPSGGSEQAASSDETTEVKEIILGSEGQIGAWYLRDENRVADAREYIAAVEEQAASAQSLRSAGTKSAVAGLACAVVAAVALSHDYRKRRKQVTVPKRRASYR